MGMRARALAMVLPAAAALAAMAAPAAAPAATISIAPTSTSAYLPGTTCRAFPASNYWHADISRLPVNGRSAQWLSHMQASSRHVHADFGPSFGAQPVPYGIPITVVNGARMTVVCAGVTNDAESATVCPMRRSNVASSRHR